MPDMASPSCGLSVRLVGGPTAVLEYAGLRLLTDPTFDPPGRQESGLTKLTPPALSAEEVGPIDAVLLSHDQHADNLDVSGHAFLPRARRTLTTVAGAARLGGNAVGLEPWASTELERPAGSAVTVTAVPAQGWAHFTQGAAELGEAFAQAGIGDRLVVAEPGASVSV
jgi:L-ascorbate metabolism protein UlaG (beta-lactamase superfamily)